MDYRMGDFNMYANDLGFVVTNEATFLTTIVKEYKEEGGFCICNIIRCG